MSFIIPTAFVQLHTNAIDILHVSRQIAVVTFLTYVAYITFQLVTHKNLFDGDRPVPITDMGEPIAQLFA